jgi:KamA family protein
MNCRFCFRQNYDYETQDKTFAQEIELIRQDPSLSEIILSGGDPLSLSNETLTNLIRQLDQIPHLERLRFHTRFPIGIPERIDKEFLALLEQIRLQVFFIIHSNHPSELDAQVLSALKKIQKLGIPVLNQAVLLHGVNDNIPTLKALCEKLAGNGILPYYLHQLDRVQGAAHFEVSEEKGRALIAELTELMSGYAVPKYVKEEAGEPSKTSLLEVHPLCV